MSTANSLPGSRSSSVGSSSRGRPVPVLPSDSATQNVENGVSGQPLDEDSDSDARKHYPASNPRTQFTALTPAAEKEAITSLKTRMTFSDNSAPSSTASTPNKSTQPPFPPREFTRGAKTDPSKLQTTRQQKVLEKSASPITHLAKAELNGDRLSDGGSEGEINSSVTVSSLLSKLDSVRNFLKEAETLHGRFQNQMAEPGVPEQIAKLERLIAELKEQESSHLGVLLAVMEGGHISKKDLELSEDEESEDNSDSEGDGPANQTVVKASNDDSFSLRAQLEKRHQENAEKEEELKALKQQQELLRKLLTQQRQIKELEMRQAALLKMKQQAQLQIAEAEAKSAEIQKLTEGGEDKEKQEEENEEEMESGQPAMVAQSAEEQKKSATPPSPSAPQDRGGEQEMGMEQLVLDERTSEPLPANQESLLLMKIAELRARKERVERLVGLLGSMRMEDSGEAAATTAPLSKKSAETQEHVPAATSVRAEPSQVTSQAEAGDVVGVSAEATTKHSGPSELVRDEEPVGMAELQERIQKAEEARKKLRALQEMISQLHDYSPDNSEPEDNASPPEQLHWRLDNRQDSRGRGQMGVSLSDGEDSDDEAEEEGEAGNVTLNTTLTEDFDPAEQSLVEQYQSQLTARREEVVELQRQRDELRRTQDRLLLLQSQLLVPGGGDVEVKSKPSSGKGQLSRRNKAEEKALDTTTATWGGSTLPSELEEGEKSPGSGSSVSLPSDILAEMTQDSILPNASALAGSASVEQRGASQGKPAFKVTRHTPRNVLSQRPYRMRTISSPADHTQTKRRKLDSQNVSLTWQPEPQEVPRPTNPDPYATAYFTSPQQQAPQLDMSHMTTDSSQYHTSMLYSQLAMTSNMCSELLHSQNNLVGAVCSHLEMMGHQAGIQQHRSALFQYQKELEQYYQDLYQRYSQMSQQHPTQSSGGFQSAGAQTEPEDPVGSLSGQQFDGTQGSTGRGSPANEMPGSSNAQLHEGSTRMPPPPPSLSTQPHHFHFRGYSSQQAGGDVRFGMNAEAATNASEGNQGLSAPPAPPIPPLTFNPYHMPFRSPYHMHPYYYGSSPMSHSYGSAPPFGVGFGPAPNIFNKSGFSPSPQFASLRPGSLPGYPYPYRSPMSYPRQHHWSHTSPGAAMLGSPGQASQFAPPQGFPPYPFMNSLPPFTHPPFAGHFPSHAPPSFPPGPPSNLSTSFADRGGLGNLRPSSLLPPQANLHDDHLGFHSPSGVTAASLQVQPPSSPPSAPSVNLQTSSTNQNNCNATSMAMPKMGTSESSTTGLMSSLLNPTSLGGPLQYLSFPPAGGTSTTSPLGQFSFSATAQQPSSLTKVSETARLYNFRGLKSGTTTAVSGNAIAKKDEQGRAESNYQPELEEESLSSLPVSIPEELSHLQLDALEDELFLSRPQPGDEEALASDVPPGSVFDSLRETIYSEVATFIANNELRPHFLVELFRELQMLTTDYLRQRALYNLQDLVTRYLTEEGVAEEAKAATSTANLFQGWVAGSASERTPSESGVTTEEEPSDLPKPLIKTNSQKYDYVEPVHSASSLSTPPNSSPFSDEPFASENLGATAVRLDKEMAKMKRQVISGQDEGASPLWLRPPVISPGPLKTNVEDLTADMNTEQLDELIKMIMIEVIPIFKENLEFTCTPEILAQIRQVIISLIVEQEEVNEQKQELFEAFTKQLEGAINAAAEKYCEKPLKECGEDLLVEISEVLFNELTFFRLLKDFKGHPQLSADLVSTASQSTTENEDYEGGKPLLPLEAAAVSASASDSQPWDPMLMQALCLVANNTNLAEEEEALGKSRDDDLATTWDNNMQDHDRSSLSADEDGLTKVVELSLSESQPLNSAGSGEEDNEEAETTAAALESVQPPPPPPSHMSNDDDALREATPTPVNASQPEQEQQPLNDCVKERGGETPPTPQATEPEPSTDPNEAAAQEEGDKTVASSASGDDKDGDTGTAQEDMEESEGIEQATGIGREEALSPIGTSSRDQPLVLVGINEKELEAQMKKEQQTTEGLVGILASIDEKGSLELAGDGNELATPSQKYVEA